MTVAQTDGFGISDSINSSIKDFLNSLIDGILALVGEIIGAVASFMLGTPYPGADGGLFGPPTDSTWSGLYSMHWDSIIPLTTLLLMLSLGLILFTNIWRDPYNRQKAGRKIMMAIPFVLIWWYLGGWYLEFINSLTDIVLTLGGTGPGNVEGLIIDIEPEDSITAIIGAVVVYIIGLLPVALVMAIYVARWVLLHVYLTGMPILVAIWCIPWGPFSGWAEKAMGGFVPLSLLPLPVAFLLAIFQAIELSGFTGGIMEVILGFIILAIAGIVPKYMFGAASSVGSSIKTAARGGRAAAVGASTAGATGGGGGGSGGSGGQSTFEEYGGSSTGTGAGEAGGGGGSPGGAGAAGAAAGGGGSPGGGGGGRSPTFEHPSASKARRQRERAAKVGYGARRGAQKSATAGKKAAKKTGSAAETAAGTAYKNYTKDGSTVKGIASDAQTAGGREGIGPEARNEFSDAESPKGEGPPSPPIQRKVGPQFWAQYEHSIGLTVPRQSTCTP